MRTPKEVIEDLVSRMGQDPFMESIESMEKGIAKDTEEVNRAEKYVKQLQDRLQAKRDYLIEREATLAYIKELPDV